MEFLDLTIIRCEHGITCRKICLD